MIISMQLTSPALFEARAGSISGGVDKYSPDANGHVPCRMQPGRSTEVSFSPYLPIPEGTRRHVGTICELAMSFA